MKKIAAFLLLSIYSFSAVACTTFLLSKNGQHVFGRNYDWVTGTGMVMINAKGLQKTSVPTGDGKTISWTSSCGSITFNQYGKEFPTGGMNEKGLVVELMWLSEARYPSTDDRAAIGTLQWIQYQLDNCATVDEVIATDKILRISNFGSSVPLHYLVADASGNAATIEFLNGKMVVNKGKDLNYPVLTNTIYKDALQQSKQEVEKKKTTALDFNDNSIQRFAIACSMVQQFQQVNEAPVPYAFSMLQNVSQGNFTKWSIVYDITNKQIHFKTTENKNQRTVSFNDFDFSCNTYSLAYNMADVASGTIKKSFKPLTPELNKWLIQKSAKESSSRINIDKKSIDEVELYLPTIKCISN